MGQSINESSVDVDSWVGCQSTSKFWDDKVSESKDKSDGFFVNCLFSYKIFVLESTSCDNYRQLSDAFLLPLFFYSLKDLIKPKLSVFFAF